MTDEPDRPKYGFGFRVEGAATNLVFGNTMDNRPYPPPLRRDLESRIKARAEELGIDGNAS
jgi:hypothetical protein